MAVIDASECRQSGQAFRWWFFAHSNLRRAMDGGHLNVPPPAPLPNSKHHDAIHVCWRWCLPLCLDLQKPYSHRELDHDQKVYNYRLSRARRVVENAFGILANRLRLFRTTICLDPEKVVEMYRSQAYTTSTLVDWEHDDQEVMPGEWGKKGLGPFMMWRPAGHTIPPKGPKIKEIWWKNILSHYKVKFHGKKTTFSICISIIYRIIDFHILFCNGDLWLSLILFFLSIPYNAFNVAVSLYWQFLGVHFIVKNKNSIKKIIVARSVFIQEF